VNTTIRTFDDPVLRTACATVEQGEDLGFLLALQRACQLTPDGVGLAAPQIGILKRAVFIWPNRLKHPAARCYTLVNPRLIGVSAERVEGEEGCLSYPGVRAIVSRHKWIRVAHVDRKFREQFFIARDFEARVIQHELDHLDGVCHVGDAYRRQRLAAQGSILVLSPGGAR
jgi:peptide deformylase